MAGVPDGLLRLLAAPGPSGYEGEAAAVFRELAEPWADTTSPAGRMVLTIFAGMAEFERALIHQRTSSGRTAAMERGVRFGRPPKLTPDQIALGRRLVLGDDAADGGENLLHRRFLGTRFGHRPAAAV